jgi:hypothetical protein
MKWRFAGSVLLTLAAVSGAGAQSTSLPPEATLRIDYLSRKQVEALIDSARDAGLPWNALRSSAIKGAMMKTEGKRIVASLREYYKALELSKVALGRLATDEEVDAGAAVLLAHVTPDDLAKFRVVSRNRSPLTPLTYLADLITNQDVPRDEAIGALSKLWKDGAADSDFDGLWHAVDQDILSGLNPRSALQSRMQMMSTRKPPGEI